MADFLDAMWKCVELRSKIEQGGGWMTADKADLDAFYRAYESMCQRLDIEVERRVKAILYTGHP